MGSALLAPGGDQIVSVEAPGVEGNPGDLVLVQLEGKGSDRRWAIAGSDQSLRPVAYDGRWITGNIVTEAGTDVALFIVDTQTDKVGVFEEQVQVSPVRWMP